MTRLLAVAALAAALALAGEKHRPQGAAEDDAVALSATVLDADEIREAVGTDFDKHYTALEVRITPRGGKPLAIHLDDFILRSESSGDHSPPFVAGQLAGAGEMVVTKAGGGDGEKGKKGRRSISGGLGGAVMQSPGTVQQGPLEGAKVEMKDNVAADPALAALKKKILVEKTIEEPVTGLLFFPLEKEKPRNLILSYTSPRGKLRLSFR